MTQQNIPPDVDKPFDKWADDWWNPNGSFKPLHDLHPCRMEFIVNQTEEYFNNTSPVTHNIWPNLDVLDIGCGGGLTAESIARLGARVTGIDESHKTISIAAQHACLENLQIDYQPITLAALIAQNRKFDLILALEVIEHVDSPTTFLEECTALLKTKGTLIISTLNRTPVSYLKSIIIAEHVLKLIPQGTHDWSKFLKPAEISSVLKTKGLFFKQQKGIDYRPLHRQWVLSNNISNNYIMAFTK